MIKTVLAVLLLLSPWPRAALAQAGSVRGKVTGTEGARLVVVYIEKAKAAPAPRDPVRLSQKGSTFTPGVLLVRAGTKVEFANEDKIYHDVFSLTPGAQFDLGLYRGGESRTMTFDRPGEIDVYCNIHPQMNAKVLVLQNEHYGQPGPGGSYAIAGVPPGRYTVVAWTAEHKPERKEIEIQPGRAASLDFALTPRPANRFHLNKHGEQYGRYR